MISGESIALPGDSYVLGVEDAGESRAYPLATIRRHHIINDRLAGRPIAVTFCPKCFAGIGFDARLHDRALTFDVFGMYRGSMVMTDSQTQTVWDRFTGQGLIGPSAGESLAAIPTHLGRLGEWVAAHPGTLTPDP